MKKIMCFLCMSFGIVCSASATGNAKATDTKNKTSVTKKKTAAESNMTMLVEQRANHLSDQMIRELRLNNYQSNKVRTINMDMAAEITQIEQEFNGNQELIEEKCKAALAVRDQEFEDILSTVQYNNYFGDRKVYTKADREYVASLSEQGSENLANDNGKATEGATAGNAAAGTNASTVN